MNVFENVELKWAGEVYTIPANRMMGAIARLEEVVTLGELRDFADRKAAPIAKLSMAYATMLRFAGAKVLDEEVYAKMAKGDADVVLYATRNVMMMMVPPSLRKGLEEGDEAPASGNRKARRKTSALSRKRTS